MELIPSVHLIPGVRGANAYLLGDNSRHLWTPA
jgi:hypothetical protein